MTPNFWVVFKKVFFLNDKACFSFDGVQSQITNSNGERIIGGLQAQQGQFPFQVKEISDQLL